jgi:hypothetical protein
VQAQGQLGNFNAKTFILSYFLPGAIVQNLKIIHVKRIFEQRLWLGRFIVFHFMLLIVIIFPTQKAFIMPA